MMMTKPKTFVKTGWQGRVFWFVPPKQRRPGPWLPGDSLMDPELDALLTGAVETDANLVRRCRHERRL
jgi:hypothetical protein